MRGHTTVLNYNAAIQECGMWRAAKRWDPSDDGSAAPPRLCV